MDVPDVKLIVRIENVLRVLLQLLRRRLGGHFVEDLRVGREELDVVVAVLDLRPVDRSPVLRGDAIVDERAFRRADQTNDGLYQLLQVPAAALLYR